MGRKGSIFHVYDNLAHFQAFSGRPLRLSLVSPKKYEAPCLTTRMTCLKQRERPVPDIHATWGGLDIVSPAAGLAAAASAGL
jgi:hypothetical protein